MGLPRGIGQGVDRGSESSETVSRTWFGADRRRRIRGAPTGGVGEQQIVGHRRHDLDLPHRGARSDRPHRGRSVRGRSFGDLCVLTCGRSAMPWAAAYEAARSRLAASRSRSTIGAGVSISATDAGRRSASAAVDTDAAAACRSILGCVVLLESYVGRAGVGPRSVWGGVWSSSRWWPSRRGAHGAGARRPLPPGSGLGAGSRRPVSGGPPLSTRAARARRRGPGTWTHPRAPRRSR